MQPIPVLQMRFVDDRQSGPGFECSSSLTSALKDPRRRHFVEYHPWVRSFWVEFYDRGANTDGAQLEASTYIPLDRVLFWTPAEKVSPPSRNRGKK